MLDWINSWASNIVIAVIIATIIEMILPEGNNKKYVKTVIGVFVLFTIVSPIFSKLTVNKISLEDELGNMLEVDNMSAKETVSMETSDNIEKVYIANLKEDIKKRLKEKGYEAKELNVEVNMNEDAYGEISKLSFRMAKAKSNKEVEKVNTIEIQIGETVEKEEAGTNISSEEYESMRKYIADYYEMNIEKINIY